ncbi:hypothetical protein IV203_027219 [Nitzschia inconspicua]|uniref:DUF6824 domain-containing protein n=1 Tax=Nitzschia inconspicua TaxID=303405 RepID=A0A9K3LVV4_9STRA|nr:hypothetical protein IV203_027219 [Nitzschia inconspicua]
MILKEGLSVDDVLLGRGTGSNDHDGNVRFRAVVRQVLRESLASSCFNQDSCINRAVCSKSSMAATVLSIVHGRGGKFVRKASKVEIDAYLEERVHHAASTYADEKMVSPSSWYAVVPRQVALEKAKQSFRHQKRVLRAEGEPAIKVAKEAVAATNHFGKVQNSSCAGTSASDTCLSNLNASHVLKVVQMQSGAESEQQMNSKSLSQYFMKHTGCSLVPRLGNPMLPPPTTGTNDSLAMWSNLFSGNAAPSSPSTSSSSTPSVLGQSAPVPDVSTHLWNKASPPFSLLDLASTLCTNALHRALKQNEEHHHQRQQQQQQRLQERQVALFILMAAAAVEAST